MQLELISYKQLLEENPNPHRYKYQFTFNRPIGDIDLFAAIKKQADPPDSINYCDLDRCLDSLFRHMEASTGDIFDRDNYLHYIRMINETIYLERKLKTDHSKLTT